MDLERRQLHAHREGYVWTSSCEQGSCRDEQMCFGAPQFYCVESTCLRVYRTLTYIRVLGGGQKGRGVCEPPLANTPNTSRSPSEPHMQHTVVETRKTNAHLQLCEGRRVQSALRNRNRCSASTRRTRVPSPLICLSLRGLLRRLSFDY